MSIVKHHPSVNPENLVNLGYALLELAGFVHRQRLADAVQYEHPRACCLWCGHVAAVYRGQLSAKHDAGNCVTTCATRKRWDRGMWQAIGASAVAICMGTGQRWEWRSGGFVRVRGLRWCSFCKRNGRWEPEGHAGRCSAGHLVQVHVRSPYFSDGDL